MVYSTGIVVDAINSLACYLSALVGRLGFQAVRSKSRPVTLRQFLSFTGLDHPDGFSKNFDQFPDLTTRDDRISRSKIRGHVKSLPIF